MKTFSGAAMAEIIAGTAIEVGAVEILGDPPLRVWGGPWPIVLGGENYIGVGDRGLVRTSAASLGPGAQSIGLELSGVDPDTLALLDADEVRSAPTILYRLIFNGAGTTLLDMQVFTRGRLDQIVSDETVGGPAVIRATIEGAARGLRRRGGRMRTDADQRLINSADGGMRRVAYAAQKTLYWGGKPPVSVGSALGAASFGGIGDIMLAQMAQR